jgi:hypothetical protein
MTMKTTDPRRRLHAALRTRLGFFIRKAFHTVDPGRPYEHNWHLDALAHVLEACGRGEIRRLIITLPPRHMKSLCATVAFPAWLLGRDPSLRIVCASYGAELSTKHSLDTRRIMESAWYQELFPSTQLSAKKNTQAEITTTDGGFRYDTSVQGSLTGRGGDFLIIDDPHKANEVISDVQREAVIEWANNTVVTRLDNKQTGCIILIMQRLHEGDLAGVWLDKGGWYHLNLPATAEREESIPLGGGRYHVRRAGDVLHAEREPQEVLDQLKLDLGSYAFAAQYQQRPAPLGGGLIKLEWLKRYEGTITPQPGDYLVLSCDTAYTVSETADWTVILVWLVRPWKASRCTSCSMSFARNSSFLPSRRRSCCCGRIGTPRSCWSRPLARECRSGNGCGRSCR